MTLSKEQFIYGGGLLFGFLFSFLYLLSFFVSGIGTVLFYSSLDLNEIFGQLSFFVWLGLWFVMGAVSGAGFYKKNKLMAYVPIVIFITINVLGDFLLMQYIKIICVTGGCEGGFF